MSGNNANPSGSEQLDATSLDNPENLEFYDPELDGEIEEDGGKGTESEAETESEQEEVEAAADEEDTEAAEEPEEGQAEEAEEPQPIVLPTGESVTQEELVAGYMKEADYRRKTMALGETRREVTANAERMQRQVEKFAEFLTKHLPDEPDASLAYSNPQAYTAQKAAYDQQLAVVKELLAVSEEPKQIAKEMSESETLERLSEENERLAAAFPMTTNPKGRKDFFSKAGDAAKALGFTDQEVAEQIDSRMFGLAYYASLGLEAEKAKQVAKRKVSQAPKAAPKRQRLDEKSNKAMQKLRQSGSIHDAVMVDFE